jgi:hypothetical protein
MVADSKLDCQQVFNCGLLKMIVTVLLDDVNMTLDQRQVLHLDDKLIALNHGLHSVINQ